MLENFTDAPLTALLLDDEDEVFAAADHVLTRHGCALIEARSADKARAILDQTRVDVLLLNLNFRRGDVSGEAGLQFLEERLELDTATPVVVVTGLSFLSVAVRAMRMGATDFIVKPWHEERFIASLHAAIEMPRPPPLPLAPIDLNLDRSERDLIKRALDRHNFNISLAAKDLGLTRASLYRRMEKHGL